MKAIFEENPNVWVDWDGTMGKEGFILATIGTSEEMSEEMKVPGIGGPCQWSVSLVGGKRHPRYGQSYGIARTLEEAQARAEEFLNSL